MRQQPNRICDLGPTSSNGSASIITSYRLGAIDNHRPAQSPNTDVWSSVENERMIDGLTASDIIIAYVKYPSVLVTTHSYPRVMGPTGAGKSTFINMASGNEEAVIGHGIISCTKEVQQISYVDEARGARVVLVDTPGFDDTNLTDLEILRRIAEWLRKTYGKGILLSGILIFHKISDNRMGGTPLGNLKMYQDLCGKSVLPNVVLVTTMWEEVTPEEGRKREEELQCYWEPMLARGARMLRFHHTETSAQDIISSCRGTPHALSVQDEMERGKPWYDTSAARTLLGSLGQQVKRFLDWLRRLDPWRRDAVISGIVHRWQPLPSPIQTPPRRLSVPSSLCTPTLATNFVPPIQTDFSGSPCTTNLSPALCPSPSQSFNSISEQIQELKRLYNSISVSELQDTARQMLSIMERIHLVDPEECIVPSVEKVGSLTVEHVYTPPSIPRMKETVHQFQIVLSKMNEDLQTILSRDRGLRVSASHSAHALPRHSTGPDDEARPSSSGGDNVHAFQGMETRIAQLEALLLDIREDLGAPFNINAVNIYGGNFVEIQGDHHHVFPRSPSPNAMHERVGDPQTQPIGHRHGTSLRLARHTL